MSRDSCEAPLVRCLAVWLAGTALAVALTGALVPDLHGLLMPAPGQARFDRLLTGLCALALAACAAWFWLALTAVTVEAATGRLRPVPGCPAALRRVVLLACGAGLVLGPTQAWAEGAAGRPPSPASGVQVLAGLPLPERPTGSSGSHEPTGPGPTGPGPTGSTPTVVVSRGDSLWSIAEESLEASASDAAVDRAWRRIWFANRSVIGQDPHVIHPGTRLHLPEPKEQ